MSGNYNNFGLFDKYLHKVSVSTVKKFGSHDRLVSFLHTLCEKGSVALAAKDLGIVPLPAMPGIIKNDRYFGKCVDLALKYAAEVVEAVLYDRAINGYEELTFNLNGECVARKKKYCSRSLLEYLKANSPKYQIKKQNREQKQKKQQTGDIGGFEFEVESYSTKSE